MNCDSLIVLSDCSDDSYCAKKTKSKENDYSPKLRDKVDSDFSDSEFPIVRFSEINFNPNSRKGLDNSRLSEFNLGNKNDSRNSNKDKFNDSCVIEANIDIENLRNNDTGGQNKVISEDSFNIVNNLSTAEKESSYSNFPEVNFNNSYSDNINKEKQSEIDSDYESQYINSKYTRNNYQLNDKLSNDESESDINAKVVEKKVRKRGKKLTQQSKDTEKDSSAKIPKKPGPKPKTSKTNPKDNIKLVEVVIDKEIEGHDFFDDFVKASEENEIMYSVQTQLIPKSITWKRKVEEINEDEEVSSNVKIIHENQILIIWSCEETIKHVSENTFVSAILNITSMVPSKKLSLVIYKMQSYFKYIKNSNGRGTEKDSLDNEKRKKSKSKSKGFSSFPKISRKKLEECLVEIQLLYNTNSRYIENKEEMIMLIQQYTKSLANLQSKMEKDEKLSEIDWCISCDNKDSVKIDRDGNGLIRLWQQQLCQFAQTSLETSEAIASVYKSPLQLIEAYANCTQIEGEALLKDIPIRRNAGILTSSKRIGPELSKKLFIMFTAKDGEVCLNE